MSRRSSKKNKERQFVEILREQLKTFPDGELIDSESPDFVIAARDGLIGVETTRLHQMGMPHESRRQESERQALVNEALQIYENAKSIPLRVSVNFGPYEEFNKRNRRRFVSILANLVRSNIPQPESWITIQNDWDNPSTFPYEIASISICRSSALRRNRWLSPSVGCAQQDFIPELEAIIAKKDKSITRYKIHCVACWLLIAAEGDSAPTFFYPSTATLGYCYRSSFDRIFFLEAFSRGLWELTCSAE